MARIGTGLSIVGGALLLSQGCGDRTGADAPGYEHRYNIDGGGLEDGGAAGDGAGGRAAGGRRGGTGGRRGGMGGRYYGGGGYRAMGGYPGRGGYYGYGGYPGPGGYYGYGGYPGPGGYYGYGGYIGGTFGRGGYYSTGGYYGVGGSSYCTYPYCGNCTSCFEQCLCFGSSTSTCYSQCYGAGGAAGGPNCDPSFCPTSTIPNVNLQLAGCCTGDQCGVEVDLIASVLPIVGGCQARNQYGTYDLTCSSLPSPVGGTLPGCCRIDGTCGVDLTTVGIGCAARSGPVEFCGRGGGMGVGGIGGTFGRGGSPSTGGRTAGGTTGDGGRTATGGSVAVEQCVNQAHSDCEVCACKSCFDGIAPCFQDVGCPAILQCANLTGCSGVNCYTPTTCQSVIDQYGGLIGSSVQLALPLFQCLRNAACPCGFAP